MPRQASAETPPAARPASPGSPSRSEDRSASLGIARNRWIAGACLLALILLLSAVPLMREEAGPTEETGAAVSWSVSGAGLTLVILGLILVASAIALRLTTRVGAAFVLTGVVLYWTNATDAAPSAAISWAFPVVVLALIPLLVFSTGAGAWEKVRGWMD